MKPSSLIHSMLSIITFYTTFVNKYDQTKSKILININEHEKKQPKVTVF